MKEPIKFKYKNKEYQLILMCLTGSRMYGTHYEKGEYPFDKNYISDYDYRGIFIPSPENNLGIIKDIDEINANPVTQKELNISLIQNINKSYNLNIKEESDIVLYNIDKFFDLAISENPSIIDILFMNKESKIYSNKYGEEILNNKKMFLTKAAIDRFIGYSQQQLLRMSNHNKSINKFPDYSIIKNGLRKAYNESKIDYNWITVNFSGELAKNISNKQQQQINNETKKIKNISIEEFYNNYINNLSFSEFKKYMKPDIIDYLTLKSINNKKIKLNDIVFNGLTSKEILKNQSSFRKISPDFFNIYTYNGKKSFITNNNDINKQEPKEIGNFLFHCSFNRTLFENDSKNISIFWKWQNNRNEKRSILEEKFGFDTKHGSHLCRLMTSALQLASTGTITPKLSGENFILAKNILEGRYTYDEVIDIYNSLKKEVIIQKTKKVLPESKDIEKINNFLIDIKKDVFLKQQKIRKKNVKHTN